MRKDDERIELFKQKYPNLFKNIRCGYFTTNDGWDDLLNKLFFVLENHIDDLPMEIKGEMWLFQVKEKFGGLRVYMNQSTPYMDGAILLAETMSFSICEDCGAPGQACSGDWIRVLCEACEEVEKKRKRDAWKKWKEEVKKDE